MFKDDLRFHLALDRCPGIGPVHFKELLLAHNNHVETLFQMDAQDLSMCGLKAEQISYIQNPDWAPIEQALTWLDQDPRHLIITLNDPRYPKLLKEIHDAPPVLYLIGRHELLNTPQIAIVGSRNCTPGGADTAQAFARYLSNSGMTITSGMALGIDKHAHLGALQGSGNTIAVIGTGIDRIYPSRNQKLAHQIAEEGLIISEFQLGTQPNSANFPKRNRLISGLSLAILVVEATQKSGSLITARLGLEQGREVFAIPGSIHNPQAKGCHHLIRSGAKLVDQASDIIDDIGSLLGYVAEKTDLPEDDASNPLEQEYQDLLELMGYDPVSLDTMVERSGLTIEQLSSMLLILELNDFIQPAPGGLYLRC